MFTNHLADVKTASTNRRGFTMARRPAAAMVLAAAAVAMGLLLTGASATAGHPPAATSSLASHRLQSWSGYVPSTDGALARIQLTKAALMDNRLEAATEALGSVLALDPQCRISSLIEHLETCRQLLRVLCYRGSGTAQALEQKLAAAHSAPMPGGP
jgi:hypothetical protein